MDTRTGPANGIIGGDFTTELPMTQVPEQDLTEERNAARFSQTKEYQRLKTHLESRIDYYQKFMPDGTPIVGQDITKLATQWAVANSIIAEFKAVIDAYEQAKETVANADARTAA